MDAQRMYRAAPLIKMNNIGVIHSGEETTLKLFNKKINPVYSFDQLAKGTYTEDILTLPQKTEAENILKRTMSTVYML